MNEETPDLSADEYHKVQQLGGWDLCEKICEAVIEIPELRRLKPPFSAEALTEDQKRNPILTILMVDHYIPAASMSHSDLATIFRDQTRYFHERQKISISLPEADGKAGITMLDGSPLPSDDDFIPLTRFIKHNTSLPHIDSLPDWLFASPDIEQIIWWYFASAQSQFDEALERACRCVQQGIPLYEQTEDGIYSQVPFEHPDCIYLTKKAEYHETGGAATERPGLYPAWTEGYFFKWGHLTERERFFGGWKQYHSPEALTILRDALRRHLGFAAAPTRAEVAVAGSRARQFHTQLSGIVDQILNGHSAGFLELKSEGEEWPKQELAVPWLQKTFGLSEAEAKAVDAVTRPDTLRARGKRSRLLRPS